MIAQAILFLFVMKINLDFLNFFLFKSSISIRRKLFVSFFIGLILKVLCIIFLMLYTIPTTYYFYYDLCRNNYFVGCNQYMALFNINIADIVILVVFSIIFNILTRRYIRIKLAKK